MDNREVVLADAIDKAEKEKLEKMLLKNNISYFEKTKEHGLFSKVVSHKYTIYVHQDSLERAKGVLQELKK
jgi:ABC-type phosphate/phosphonate transport system substrate-binding protein